MIYGYAKVPTDGQSVAAQVDALTHERELILSRTREGRARAKAQGVHMGRRPKLTPFQRTEAQTRVANGETTRDVARSYNVSHSTISRIPA